uniref:TIP41-like protein n=1 Tax=Lactuca sativa TaxID=4236 RepID=A0A9R1XC39_LACSA|nr:hypothetical protein LSAT_V11C500269840 [Lactuca sativa]
MLQLALLLSANLNFQQTPPTTPIRLTYKDGVGSRRERGGKKSLSSGIKVHFNAFDALLGWKKEALPPVEVPGNSEGLVFLELRVDGALMRLRDTRVFCTFNQNSKPLIIREICWRETTFKALASKGYPSDSASYNDPNIISQRLPIVFHNTQKLKIPS